MGFMLQWACAVKVYFLISQVNFSEPEWYCDAEDFPEPKRHIGHWLGEATCIGQAMC